MSKTNIKLLTSVAWLITIVCFLRMSLELFLSQIVDYDIYRVFNISFSDFLILTLILIVQYSLLKKLSPHIDIVRHIVKDVKHQKLILSIITFVFVLIYVLIPSQFSIWISLVLHASLCLFYLVLNYFTVSPFLKVAFLILFGAAMNSSLIFWIHEESNAGRHISYAKQLAEKQDTIAENILTKFGDIGKTISNDIDREDFWERQWLENAYLASNYRMKVEEKEADGKLTHYQPILTFDKSLIPIYKIYFPDNYALSFKPNTNFTESIYSPQLPFKNLEDLDDFLFAVVDNSNIILSNSHAFNPYILDIDLPPIGKGEKIELEGFDILAYHHSKDVFVLIGEPLSEIQVWISNFAFFFSLLLGVAIFLEIIVLFILKKNIVNYWQELPIQYRIQFILIGITCLLFFIIAGTTFLFLDQNNATISYDRQVYVSEGIRKEIMEEEEQFGKGLSDFSVLDLAELGDKKSCDIDFYRADGSLIVSSFATAANSPAPSIIDGEIIQQVAQNQSLVLVDKQYANNNESYLRTYFGIFHDGILEGVASISSYTSEIGTSPYIPIVMIKLLNVYVFLLLISWGGGLLLIGLLTKPLELLASRLSNFKLGKKNEKLTWKGDDAIGQLITEYNKMVDKIELTTQDLIRSEREGAWQIMAQQIAHEINNKLTPLRLNTQFLSRIVDSLSPVESETIQRITNALVGKIDGLSKVATQFKLFAKLETPEVKPIELKEFIKHFIEAYKQRQGIYYNLKLGLEGEHNTTINIDTQHLQEILNNIISNAENSIPDNREGMITCGISTQDNSVIIEVQDNGVGIKPEIIENIFDPKFSVNSSQTGLGLPICKRIIEFYNGQLSFETAEAEGTSFFISFPNSDN